MRFISLFFGKAILKFLRLTGRGGSALPGLVVEKLNPKFLRQMLSGLPKGVIIVTGTNGKTTTTKTIAAILEGQGLRVLTNKSGSNFVRGVVATVINSSSLSGKLNYDIAVLEQDEAHAVHFVHQVTPSGVVALNIMRDQMDRFGEIDTTAKLLQKVVGSAKDWVVLNANDQRVGNLKSPAKKYYFGHSKELQKSFLTDDELHHQDDGLYHLAGDMDYELTDYRSDSVVIKHDGKSEAYTTNLAGSHNAINLAAAITTLGAVLPDYDAEKLKLSIKDLKPAFGRSESFSLNNSSKIMLQLVKNPGGFTHSLRMLGLENYDVVGMAINDDYADGRDVSWLWDVDFNALEDTDKKVITGGTRAYDMAVRLKYDGVTTTKVVQDLRSFVESINKAAENKTAIIFCTYTAMLKIRAHYQKQSQEVYEVEV